MNTLAEKESPWSEEVLRFPNVLRSDFARKLVYTMFVANNNTCLCMKNVCIRSCSDPYFPTFGLNMELYIVSLGIQLECGKYGPE